MQKIIHDFSTEVFMSNDEAENICKLGQGDKCCAFLICGAKGFECARMEPSISSTILFRLSSGTMNAKSEGGWSGCAWENELDNQP